MASFSSLRIHRVYPVVFHELINNFAAADPSASNAFFQQYSLPIIQDIFFVMTDTEHKSGRFLVTSVVFDGRFSHLLNHSRLQTAKRDSCSHVPAREDGADPSATV